MNNYIIDKNGTLIIEDGADQGEIARLLEGLAAQGYVSEDALSATSIEGALQKAVSGEAAPAVSGEAAPAEDVPKEEDIDASDRLSIELPWEGFTEQAYNNLVRVVESKAGLLCKSIGADKLIIQRDDERICFPWFSPDSTPEEVAVYT